MKINKFCNKLRRRLEINRINKKGITDIRNFTIIMDEKLEHILKVLQATNNELADFNEMLFGVSLPKNIKDENKHKPFTGFAGEWFEKLGQILFLTIMNQKRIKHIYWDFKRWNLDKDHPRDV